MSDKVAKQSSGAFISWSKQNGRTTDLADELGLTTVFIFAPGNILLRYLRSARHTFRIFRAYKNSTVVAMLPPTPLLLCALLASKIHRTRLILDLHTGFFYDPKWRWAMKPSLKLMRRNLCIVTNSNLAQVCEREGISTVVLHDILSERISEGSATESYNIICPLSYSNDEPVAAILEAAAESPEITWRLTGSAPESIKETAPANVEFTGFIPDADYLHALSKSTAVLALTTRQDTMQRAGYEALMSHVPVVTSKFAVLKEFFDEAAIYSDADATSIRESARFAIKNSGRLRAAAAQVLVDRMSEQAGALTHLRTIIGNT